MSKIYNTTFKNPNEINDFFKKYDSNGFVDWINKNHIGKSSFSQINTIKDETQFNNFWSNIKIIYGRESINLIEFLSLTVAILTETNSTFRPTIETFGNKSNPGLSYLFNELQGEKVSYNTSFGNKSCLELFSDPTYLLSHSHKPYGSLLKNSVDPRWGGSQFPLGFSGNPDKETSKTSSDNGFIYEADFNKLKKRGYIKSIGRKDYKLLVDFILNYKGSNDKIVYYKTKWSSVISDIDTIITSSNSFDWDDIFLKSEGILASHFINIDSTNNNNYLDINISNEQTINNSISIIGNIVGFNNVTYTTTYSQRFKQLLNDLDTTQTKAEESKSQEPANIKTSQPEQAQNEQTSDTNSTTDNGNSNRDDQPKIEGLTNFFKPTIKVEPIKYTIDSNSKGQMDESTDTLGYLPFVWYNGVQIESRFLMSFSIYSNGLIPRLSVTFKDQYGLITDNGLPLDDTKIKIFINSRNKNLRPILMEFKIRKFKIMNDSVISVEGSANVNELYIKRFKSYNNKTSFDTLQDICKVAGLGFNSNVDNTDDKMTWINPGDSVEEFITKIIKTSYKSDDAFLWCYIDFYYNLNFVDIETALKQQIKGIGNIQNLGLEALKKFSNSKEGLNQMYLTNDKSATAGNQYFSDYTMMNNSTDISIKNGYLNRVKFYDNLNLEYHTFDIDSITSEGDKTIILKGAPQDDNFFNENINTYYAGKLDTDNMHKNYNYSIIQNSQNIKDIQKIGIIIKLPQPNYNLYRFQKIYVLISEESSTAGGSQVNSRLTGEWIIIDTKLTQMSNEFYQTVSLIKRELSLSPQEMDSERPENFKDNKSEQSETSTDNNNTNTQEPVAPQNQTIVHDSTGKPFRYDILFSNAQDIDSYFKQYDNGGFVGWYNNNIAGKDSFGSSTNGIVKKAAIGKITIPTNWTKVWNNISVLYGKSSCNIIEFIAINTIMLNETGAKFTPISESVGNTSNPGISYAFNKISGLKKSYNTLSDVNNKTAYDLFSNPSYIGAHAHKPYGDKLKNITDLRWKGDTFPLGFSGNPDKETSKNLTDNSFISEADFMKFRGRGFIQTTGRSNYSGIVTFIVNYTGSNSKIKEYNQKWKGYGNNYDKICDISTNSDWDDLFQNTDLIIPCIGLFIHAKSKYQIIDPNLNDQSRLKSIRNVAAKIAGTNAKDYIDTYEHRVYQQIDFLKKQDKF